MLKDFYRKHQTARYYFDIVRLRQVYCPRGLTASLVHVCAGRKYACFPARSEGVKMGLWQRRFLICRTILY